MILLRRCLVATVAVSAAWCGLTTCGRWASREGTEQRAAADSAPAALSGRLQALLDSLVRAHGNVRSGILLIEGPGFRWAGASGMAYADTATPVLPGDQFVVNSVAKIMTATIVLRLVEDGRLALDDPIARHLPASLVARLNVRDGQDHSQAITVRHLLSHTSGIKDDWACEGFFEQVAGDSARRWSPDETIRYVKDHCAPESAPGGGFHYSDTGYNLLGLIIERVTGRALHAVYREMLLGPLGMDHTYRPAYEAARPTAPGRGPSHRYLDSLECTLWPSVMTADWGGGGLVSTARDLDRFLRAFVRNGIFRNPTTRNAMFTWVESGPFHNYGLGISRVLFDRSPSPAHAGLGEVWGHAGSSHTFMFYWPREDVTMIGTLNQLNVSGSLYDTLAAIMRTVLEAR